MWALTLMPLMPLHLAGPVDEHFARYLHRRDAGGNRLERAESGRNALSALRLVAAADRWRGWRAAIERAVSLHRNPCGCAGKADRQAGAAGRWRDDVVV